MLAREFCDQISRAVLSLVGIFILTLSFLNVGAAIPKKTIGKILAFTVPVKLSS